MYFDPSVWLICPDVYLALDDHPFLPWMYIICVLCVCTRYQTHHRVDCSFFFVLFHYPSLFVSLSPHLSSPKMAFEIGSQHV